MKKIIIEDTFLGKTEVEVLYEQYHCVLGEDITKYVLKTRTGALLLGSKWGDDVTLTSISDGQLKTIIEHANK